MKKQSILILLAAVVIGLGFLFFQSIYQQHIIFLKDNTEIVADDAWIIGTTLFYQCDNDVKSIDMPKVLYVKQGGSIDAESSFILTKRLISSYKKEGSNLLSGPIFEKVDFKKWSLVSGAAILVILCCIVVFFKLKHRDKYPKPKKSSTPKKKKKKAAKTKHRPAEEAIEYQGQEAIVQFFLGIFKMQKGATEEDDAQFLPVDTHTPDGNDIYELRVKLGDEWTSRRMTIGPIGEESGSRSTCYYVIYDDHLVIKVPPAPVTKFDKYIQSIKRDGAIAEKLQPKECLIPRVTVILKKVHPFLEDQELPIDKLEEKYIDWLKENDEFQAYLKIGDTFAYFMDLSRYFFLGNILMGMHGVKSKIVEEVFNQPDIIWNPVEFEARYGQQHVMIADNLHPVYTSFENRTKSALQQNHMADGISSFQIKEWFLKYLAGENLSASDIGTKPGVASDLNAVAKKLLRENGASVDQYRRMIRAYAVNRSLQQHKSQISGLITNLIDLMPWLYEKKIAMRDLKPDNLLVAGDPSKFPQFLESAALYSIGLIDVETAVSYEAEDMKNIKQPPLGGTPSFSTPTHVLRNDTLEAIYQDLPKILHLQDWYAVIGMIYTIVTGERLFDRTAKTLLKLKADIKDHPKKKAKPLEVFRDASRTFWREACTEFELKIQENEKRLNYISLITTKESKFLLDNLISETQKAISKAMQHTIASQGIFKGDKIKKNLYAASHLKISHFKIKFLDDQAKNLQPEKREVAATILDELIYLKKQSAHLISASSALKKSVPIISSYDLLNAIFIIVLVSMHQRKWGPVID
jgi:serine/threonine protein kinase